MAKEKILNNTEIIEMIDRGIYVYATSYETEKEVAEHCALDVTEKEVEYLGFYEGADFEYKDREFLDGDWIYIIR
jgi:hypothetical protein